MLLTIHFPKAHGLFGCLSGLQLRLPYWHLEDCNVNIALGGRVCEYEAGIWEA